MTGFEKIKWARETLGLGEMAEIEDIKRAYRELARQHHPDLCPGLTEEECDAKFREATRARDILMEYIRVYRFIFTEEEYKRHLGPEKLELFDHFWEEWANP